MQSNAEILDTLVKQVRSSGKYQNISVDVIQNIGQKELVKRGSLKESVKATRNKLHQIGAAFQEQHIPYPVWIKNLEMLPEDITDPRVMDDLANNLKSHSSTRERIPILPYFFNDILAKIQPVHSVLDLACGLTPLTIPWMPLLPGFTYTAVDIYEDLADYLNRFFLKFGIDGNAYTCDLTRDIPSAEVDLVLVLKTIPCLEQTDKDAGRLILSRVNAKNILVSFPAKSLGGKSKGMVENYERHFFDLIGDQPWQVTRFNYPSELAFLIQKQVFV